MKAILSCRATSVGASGLSKARAPRPSCIATAPTARGHGTVSIIRQGQRSGHCEGPARAASVPKRAKEESAEEDLEQLPLEQDFTALSYAVEDLAKECLPLMDGVSLFLVGMMGSGKSTVGQLLAKTMSYCFFDSDDLIEQLTQKDIAAIFAEDGEENFREIESQVLSELGAYKTCVVSTGGGAVMAKKNWSYLQNGVVVYLQGPSELLAKRVVADGTNGRPMLAGADNQYAESLEKINDLMEDRKARYKQADITVSLEGSGQDKEAGAPPAVVVHRILTKLKARLDEKIDIDNAAARKEFEIQDKGPIPITGPAENPDIKAN